MTSNINYQSINENFPIAGQDNDIQVFRDNFDTIKNSLRAAQEEVSDLQANTAKTNADSNFNLKKIQNAVLEAVREQRYSSGQVTVDAVTVDFLNGPWQTFYFTKNTTLDLINFPGDPDNSGEPTPIGAGKIMLELYGDGTARTVTFAQSGGVVFKKNAGFPGSITVTSNSNPVFVEVWRYNSSVIFLNYLGQFA